MAFRTARSAHEALRPHRSASDRMNAAASLVTFSFSIAPDTPTGCAAPIFVPGAIAEMGQDIMMNVPAEAARAPSGAVRQMTGTPEARIDRMMSRMDESSPPVVSMVSRTAASRSRLAVSIPRVT